jgi:hypothetical protein
MLTFFVPPSGKEGMYTKSITRVATFRYFKGFLFEQIFKGFVV